MQSISSIKVSAVGRFSSASVNAAALPEFERPPVNEVVLSVQFEPLAKLTAAHIGLLWSGLRERFPNVQQLPPIPPARPEDLQTAPAPVEMRVEMGPGPLIPRVLFVSADETELVQVQNDRFIANWRKVREEDTYPRYPHVREYFDSAFAAFRDFVEHEDLGDIRLIQYEVIYLNQLFHDDEGTHFQLSDVLSFWGDEAAMPPLSPPEAASAALQYLIPREAPRGRLYVDVRPGFAQPGERPLVAMNLTARALAEEDVNLAELGGLDLCREHIVRAFAALTSPTMHERWGRLDV
jgi:uncharacterized protein (TIGR04255 family)